MDIEKAKEMYLSGSSTYQIGKEFNLPAQVVWKELKNAGVKIRSKTEALQKYVRYNTCIICKRTFRARERWDSGGNLSRETCSPECEHILKSNRQKEAWDTERKEHMSKLFTGRSTEGWDIKKGELSHNWKGGATPNVYRRIAFEELKLERACSVCGATEDLDVHHKDRNRKNNTKENIVIMCSHCHTSYHGKLGDNGWGLYNKQYITRITVDELKKELGAGKSIRAICRDYHMSDEVVNRLMKENNLKKLDKVIHVTPEQVKQHLLDGRSVRWINREYGITSHEEVNIIIRENNIVAPNRKYMKPKSNSEMKQEQQIAQTKLEV
jgi:hypothetical protein